MKASFVGILLAALIFTPSSFAEKKAEDKKQKSFDSVGDAIAGAPGSALFSCQGSGYEISGIVRINNLIIGANPSPASFDVQILNHGTETKSSNTIISRKVDLPKGLKDLLAASGDINVESLLSPDSGVEIKGFCGTFGKNNQRQCELSGVIARGMLEYSQKKWNVNIQPLCNFGEAASSQKSKGYLNCADVMSFSGPMVCTVPLVIHNWLKYGKF